MVLHQHANKQSTSGQAKQGTHVMCSVLYMHGQGQIEEGESERGRHTLVVTQWKAGRSRRPADSTARGRQGGAGGRNRGRQASWWLVGAEGGHAPLQSNGDAPPEGKQSSAQGCAAPPAGSRVRDCAAPPPGVAARGKGRAAREGKGMFLLSIPLLYLFPISCYLDSFPRGRRTAGSNAREPFFRAGSRFFPRGKDWRQAASVPRFPRVKCPPQPPGRRSDAYLVKADAIRMLR